DFKLETLTDVLEQTPGIGVYRQNNATDFQARGTSVNLQTDGMAQVTSGWYYLTSTLFSLDDMAEMDRIEVLKGSSGLVVGKGNYGATVNMVRKRPTRDFQASVRASAGSWDNYRVQADVGGPLNAAGTLRGRLVASGMDAGGFRDNEKSSSRMLFGALEADLAPGTLLNLGLTYRQREAHGIGTTQPIQRYTRAGAEVPWMPRSFNTGAPWGGYEQNALNLFGSLEQRLASDWTATLKFSHQHAGMDDMVAGFLYDRDRANFGHWRDMKNDNWTVNLDVTGTFDLLGRTHELLAGTGISRFRGSVQMPTNSAPPVPLADLGTRFAQGGGALPQPDTGNWVYGDNRFSQKQRYVYAAGRFRVADPLQLIAGLRVTRYEEHDSTPYWWNWDMQENVVLTPYAGLVYAAHPNVSLYASYANIFQPQTAQDEQGHTLSPEQGNTYEIGAKGEFLDKRLNASISHFWMKTRNT
ncbi:MAG: TonB-dependent receptor, partial [Comamonadaceae bacterium]|nr:TonB-dependent receptor [Comamonadaceae bacterium]